ncbi:DoxX family membrane protein [Candidatus Kaiserbacteria bacterium]|nr:DoxX family membrane protein [Candidatus Kaiserbacteria bacterium]
MLNLFPTMFLSLFAHALLRIVLGGIFIYLGCRHLFKDRASLQKTFAQHWPRLAPFLVRYFCVVEILIGGLIFVGAWTQVAAVAAMALSVKMLVLRKHFAHPAIPRPLFYVLVIGVSASLFITGAGAFAFDLPL